MFNHRVRNINSVLPIYTASGICISQTFYVNGNFAFGNSIASRQVFITGSDTVKFTRRSLFNLIVVAKDIPFTFHEFCLFIVRVAICTCYNKSISYKA